MNGHNQCSLYLLRCHNRANIADRPFCCYFVYQLALHSSEQQQQEQQQEEEDEQHLNLRSFDRRFDTSKFQFQFGGQAANTTRLEFEFT